MVENVVISYFNVESEAYQALSELKTKCTNVDGITLSQVALIKKDYGQIRFKDGFDTGEQTNDDTWKGGLIGSFVGILGGPLGMLLGLGVGSMVGAVKDTTDAVDEGSLIYSVASRMQDGDVAIAAVIQEESEAIYDRIISPFDATTIRYDAAVIQEEVEHAREVQRGLEKQAAQQMREARSEARHAKITEYKEKVKAEFNELKDWLKKND